MMMKLQIFTIKKVDSSHTWFAVTSLDFVLQKDASYYAQVFLKECKYIEQNVIRHTNDNLSNYSFSSFSDESDEE